MHNPNPYPNSKANPYDAAAEFDRQVVIGVGVKVMHIYTVGVKVMHIYMVGVKVMHIYAAEFDRQGATEHPMWRMTTANADYEMCDTYPRYRPYTYPRYSPLPRPWRIHF